MKEAKGGRQNGLHNKTRSGKMTRFGRHAPLKAFFSWAGERDGLHARERRTNASPTIPQKLLSPLSSVSFRRPRELCLPAEPSFQKNAAVEQLAPPRSIETGPRQHDGGHAESSCKPHHSFRRVVLFQQPIFHCVRLCFGLARSTARRQTCGME
jgi:hypothetical protein